MTLQALSGEPVCTDLWTSGADNGMGHIELSRGADAIVVAPASADFLAKVAQRPRRRPAVDAVPRARVRAARRARDEPADVGQRARRSATSRDSSPTASSILGPAAGDQACGEIGDGRMLEPRGDLRRGRRVRAAEAARGQARAAHRRPDVRGDRSGARHHQHELRQDGLRARAGGRRGGRDGDARQRARRRCATPAGRRRGSTSPAPPRWPTRCSRRSSTASTSSSPSPRSPTTRRSRPRSTRSRRSGAPLTITLQPTVDILATVAARPDAPVLRRASPPRPRTSRAYARGEAQAARSCR